jgi:hypothetical protein
MFVKPLRNWDVKTLQNCLFEHNVKSVDYILGSDLIFNKKHLELVPNVSFETNDQ